MEAFNKELQTLLEKYDRALGSQALLTPDGRITSRHVFVDGAKLRLDHAQKVEAAKENPAAPPPLTPEPEGEGVVS